MPCHSHSPPCPPCAEQKMFESFLGFMKQISSWLHKIWEKTQENFLSGVSYFWWLKILLKNNFLGSSFYESSITFLFPSANSRGKSCSKSALNWKPDEQLHAFNNSVASWMVPQGMNQTTMYTVNENGKLRKRMEKWACFVIEDSLKMPFCFSI